jgi:hypothetical protein
MGSTGKTQASDQPDPLSRSEAAEAQVNRPVEKPKVTVQKGALRDLLVGIATEKYVRKEITREEFDRDMATLVRLNIDSLIQGGQSEVAGEPSLPHRPRHATWDTPLVREDEHGSGSALHRAVSEISSILEIGDHTEDPRRMSSPMIHGRAQTTIPDRRDSMPMTQAVEDLPTPTPSMQTVPNPPAPDPSMLPAKDLPAPTPSIFAQPTVYFNVLVYILLSMQMAILFAQINAKMFM